MAATHDTHPSRLRGTTDRRRFNGRTPRGLTVEERFWAKVDKSAPTGCWQWTASLAPETGYGAFMPTPGRRVNAHRWAYEQSVGPVPDGMQLDHLCRNRGCVNPSHLEPVPPTTNVRRGSSPGAQSLRRDKCALGHEYAQYGVVRGGRRICRLCRAVYSRAYKEGFRGSLTSEAFALYTREGDVEAMTGNYQATATPRNDGCPECLTRDNAPTSIEHHWPTKDGYRAHYTCSACNHTWWTGWAYEAEEVVAHGT